MAQGAEGSPGAAIPLNCGNCRHWYYIEGVSEPDVGICRRLPPVIVNLPSNDPGKVFSRFPPTNKLIYCGEHIKK